MEEQREVEKLGEEMANGGGGGGGCFKNKKNMYFSSNKIFLILFLSKLFPERRS